jgi:hypothetical protein
MKRLLLFALVAAAAWYGWKDHDQWRSRGSHELIAINRSGQAIERLRIHIGDQSFAIETIENGATQRLPLRCEHDGVFKLVWNVRGTDGEKHWEGGGFSHGPVLMRHRFEFTSGNGVIWSSEPKPEKKTPRRPD